jgi:hypothetical protein
MDAEQPNEPAATELEAVEKLQEATAGNGAANVEAGPAGDAAPAMAVAAGPSSAELDAEVRRASGGRTRRSFVVAAAATAGAYGFYRWLNRDESAERQPVLLRGAFEADAAVSRGVFDNRGLAPTYKLSEARELRVNGNYGLKEEIAPENYRLQMVGVAGAASHPKYVADVTAWDYRFMTKQDDAAHAGHDTKEAPKPARPDGETDAQAAAEAAMPPAFQAAFARYHKEQGNRRPRGQEEAGKSDSTLAAGTPGLLLTMQDVRALPKVEFVTQFKCIEGWSEIVQWGGVRLRDFLAAYPPARKADGTEPRYVYMETPDGDYYCGFELSACRHPQSLLVTEMSGQPLPVWHGAPLRLHMPTKYGYKQIKRIGLIAYTDEKPDDYWTKLGYDWHAGL